MFKAESPITHQHAVEVANAFTNVFIENYESPEHFRVVIRQTSDPHSSMIWRCWCFQPEGYFELNKSLKYDGIKKNTV